MAAPRGTLGKHLLEAGAITREQLEVALREQRRVHRLLGEVLLELNFVSQEALASALAGQTGTEYVSLKERPPASEALARVPEKVCRQHRLVPLETSGRILTLAMANPADVEAMDEVQRITGLRVRAVTATKEEVLGALGAVYALAAPSEPDAEGGPPEGAEARTGRLRVMGEGERGEADAPVIKLVNETIEKAVRKRATDVHFNPDENLLRVRYRVDGILREEATYPMSLHPAIVTRVKITAGMNIAENRLPQDGRALLTMEGRRFDLRVSTFPTIHGENVVIRILNPEMLRLGLERLGFSPDNLAVFESFIEKPYGIILVTGPTGSGKTTTLYSALARLSSIERNIMTVEDPVEYEIPMIQQSQVNPRAGLTFAAGMRAILRQDPDVILVGEVRDSETAEMAIRAALTGHLVFSTLHTNDAVGAVTRLLDMGVEPFLLASTLVGVVAQRLVRTICTRCKVEEPPQSGLLPLLTRREGGRLRTAYRGRGCEQCDATGYRGRAGIFELLRVSSGFAELITARADGRRLLARAVEEGMKRMADDGLEKVESGVTTLDEVLRVTMTG